VPASNAPDEVTIPIDPKNWEIITDAMAQVVNPGTPEAPEGGTAKLSHLAGIDFAGKTGSAQTISNALKAKLGAAGKANFKDNGWFVGVEPRRDPEIVVCALLEEGEHGYLAARTAAKVIKAFVDKRRGLQQKMADKPADRPPADKPPADKPSDGKVEIGAVWTAPDPDGGKDSLRGGRFFLDVEKKTVPLATAAPGVH